MSSVPLFRIDSLLAASLIISMVFVTSPSAPASQGKSNKRSSGAKSSQTAPGQNPDQPQIAEPGATSTSPLALPFKRTWQHLTDKALPIAPTIDESRVLLPLAGGQLLCLERQTGSLLWSSDLGGVITAPAVIAGNSVLVATRKVNADGSDVGASLRALDKGTGLTIWAHDYPRAFTSPIALGSGKAFVGSADGALYALSIPGGDIAWRIETQDRVRCPPLVTSDAVYFGGDDGAIRAIGRAQGNVIWTLQTTAKMASRPVADDRMVYFGGGDGFAYAVHKQTGVIKWKSRTGAAIEAPPVLIGDRLLVASFDNFIYCLSKSTGDRLWKRRLENRITAAPIVEGDSNLIAPLHGDYIAVFLNADGRRVNIYQLEAGFEIVAEPQFVGDMLFLPTSNGLVAATTMKPAEPATTANKR
jgi:outer membrane protein assembly factor BamB